MSKKCKNRKRNRQKNTRQESTTDMEIIQHSSKEIQTIENTFPMRHYKVISKPTRWDGGNCRFVGQIGKCVGTDRIHGARLSFAGGEMVSFPFENIEYVCDKKYKAVAQEQEPMIPKKGKCYKVIKKPNRWKSHCKFLNQVGVCVLIDDRGIRLRFPNGADLSFPPECLEESEPIDINSLKSNVEINEDTVVTGNLYRVLKRPAKFGKDADRLIGMIGKAKWASYRGVCLQLSDGSGYVFDFDGIERFIPLVALNPVTPSSKVLNANTITIGRQYKVIKTVSDWSAYEKDNILNKLGVVKFATDIHKGAMMTFPRGIDKFIPFDNIEDLPRPTEAELIDLIKKQPGKILRIIKGLNKLTKLKPVMDFVEKGVLPLSDDTKPTEVLGPKLPPIQHSETPFPPTVGEASDEMMNQVVALFNQS